MTAVATMWARLWVGIRVLLCTALMGACQCCKTAEDPIARGEPPSFEDVAARYNTRVEHLDRFWSDVTVGFKSVDREGNKINEQGDGHIQVIRPRKLFLTVGKVGEVGYELGSNDTRYWWIDVRKKTAQVGEHAKFSPAVGQRAGLPVHPLDIMEVLGIMPLEAVVGRSAPSVTWSTDGRSLLVRTGTQFGGRILVLDPESYEPREVQLLDSKGEQAVKAVLTDPKVVLLPDESWPTARNPTRFEITVPSTQTSITLWARNPQNRGQKINEQAFNFETLLRQYGVTTVGRIDDVQAVLPVNE